MNALSRVGSFGLLPVERLPDEQVSSGEHSPIRGQKKERTIKRIEALDDAQVEAKETEWKLSLDAMKAVATD